MGQPARGRGGPHYPAPVARIEATVHVEAPPQRVWDVLVDWENQPRWMVDARRVVVTSHHRAGVDTTISCATDIALGVVVDDPMLVTEWDEPRVLGVRHLGRLIRGAGAFELAETPYGTALSWWEEAEMPLGPVGEFVGELVVVPYVERLFRTSLSDLKRIAESQSVRPPGRRS